MASDRISFETAEEYFFFDPDSGKLFWNKSYRNNSIKRWQEAGTFDKDGYRTVQLHSKRYRVANVIWLLMTGEWPSSEIDHIDHDPGNNHWENLRIAKTKAHNMANRRIMKNNTSGYRGVSWHKTAKKWRVSLVEYFDNPEEAARCYDKFMKEKYGEFAYLNFPET